MADNTFSVLSIDGGGIRGIIPALVLQEIEQRTGRRIADLFDLIAGTSTGGILGLGLTAPDSENTPRYEAADLVELYDERGSDIFQKSGWSLIETVASACDVKYEAEPIEGILKDRFDDISLSEALTPVLVPAYEIEQRRPYFFKSHKATEDEKRDIQMWKAARATSAAPTYFEPFKINIDGPLEYLALIDGGVYANNPASCALVEATAHFSVDPSDVFMLSLGTGENTKPIRYQTACDWGMVDWVRPMIDVVFDGVNDTVDYHLNALLNESIEPAMYHRLQPELSEETDELDNASPSNIRRLKLEAKDLVQNETDVIDDVCETLV